jgi:hypothetical protein
VTAGDALFFKYSYLMAKLVQIEGGGKPAYAAAYDGNFFSGSRTQGQIAFQPRALSVTLHGKALELAYGYGLV